MKQSSGAIPRITELKFDRNHPGSCGDYRVLSKQSPEKLFFANAESTHVTPKLFGSVVSPKTKLNHDYSQIPPDGSPTPGIPFENNS